MKAIGVICEYNPFHLGHRHQLVRIREHYGDDSAIVCVMSGNYVQRGMPAVFDKCTRAKAAVLCGADLVLELPINACLSSAEGFAAAGVQILGKICDVLSFGVESMSESDLFTVASALRSEVFSEKLKGTLSTGCSFPAARQRALEEILTGSSLPVYPNDILATEYCKAIQEQDAALELFPIQRNNNYHSSEMNWEYPSATAIRDTILSGGVWQRGVPEELWQIFRDTVPHSIKNAESAILYRLRTMQEEDYEKLPYGAEGLWRRFMHAARSGKNLEEIIAQTKTKRYTRTRIDRMILCAFLGIEQDRLYAPAPYVRVLAFNDRGRTLLRNKSENLCLRNVGERTDGSYWELEQRCSDLYGLFSDFPEPPGREPQQRVFYDRGTSL